MFEFSLAIKGLLMFPVKITDISKYPVANQVTWNLTKRLPGYFLECILHASTHSLPALIDVAFSHKNTIMAHNQGHHSTVSPQKSPLAKEFRCKRANCVLPLLCCSGLAQYEIQCSAFFSSTLDEYINL